MAKSGGGVVVMVRHLETEKLTVNTYYGIILGSWIFLMRARAVYLEFHIMANEPRGHNDIHM